MLLLGLSGAMGQVFIFVTISKFGALTCSIIGASSVRKIESGRRPFTASLREAAGFTIGLRLYWDQIASGVSCFRRGGQGFTR